MFRLLVVLPPAGKNDHSQVILANVIQRDPLILCRRRFGMIPVGAVQCLAETRSGEERDHNGVRLPRNRPLIIVVVDDRSHIILCVCVFSPPEYISILLS